MIRKMKGSSLCRIRCVMTPADLERREMPNLFRTASDRRELQRFLLNINHATDHVEGRLWYAVALAGKNQFEVVDRGLQINEGTWGSRKDFGYEEGLRHEALDLARTCYCKFVFLTQ